MQPLSFYFILSLLLCVSHSLCVVLAVTNRPSLCGQSNCRMACGLIPWPLTTWESVPLSCRPPLVPAVRLSWETHTSHQQRGSFTVTHYLCDLLHENERNKAAQKCQRELISDNCVWTHCTTWRTGRTAFIWPVAVYVRSHIGYSGLVFFPAWFSQRLRSEEFVVSGTSASAGRFETWLSAGLVVPMSQGWQQSVEFVTGCVPSALSEPRCGTAHTQTGRKTALSAANWDIHTSHLTHTQTRKCTVSKTIRLPMWIT